MPDTLEDRPAAQMAEAGPVDHAEEAATSEPQGLWDAIRESLRGTHRDYTKRANRPLHHPARDSDGAGDAHGERLCSCRYLLGGPPRP